MSNSIVDAYYDRIKHNITEYVNNVSNNLLNGNTSITLIRVNANNLYFSHDGNDVLYDKNKIVLIKYPSGATRTSYTVNANTNVIASNAFSNNTYIQNVSLSGATNLSTITNTAFVGCTSLTAVYFPNATPPSFTGYMTFPNNVGLKLYVPTGSEATYQNSLYLRTYTIQGY